MIGIGAHKTIEPGGRGQIGGVQDQREEGGGRLLRQVSIDEQAVEICVPDDGVGLRNRGPSAESVGIAQLQFEKSAPLLSGINAL